MICAKCKQEKDISEFYIRKKTGKPGQWCKECGKDYSREYRKHNGDKTRSQCRKWRQKNREYLSSWRNEYYQTHREQEISCSKEYIKKNYEKVALYQQAYRQKNHEKISARTKEYYKENHDKIINYINEYQKDRRKKDDAYKLSRNMSSSISASLSGGKSGYHWEDLVGWTFNRFREEFNEKILLANKNNPNKTPMTFDNYGTIWHIDHIIPKSLWQFNKPEDREFKQCWALCNLQPLWAKDNMRKSNKINP